MARPVVGPLKKCHMVNDKVTVKSKTKKTCETKKVTMSVTKTIKSVKKTINEKGSTKKVPNLKSKNQKGHQNVN